MPSSVTPEEYEADKRREHEEELRAWEEEEKQRCMA